MKRYDYRYKEHNRWLSGFEGAAGYEIFDTQNSGERIALCGSRWAAEKIVEGLNERELRRNFIRSLLPA